MPQKTLLMILDGWGIGDKTAADAISEVQPKFIDAWTESNPHASLRTDGLSVGLPEGQMGNSEVGHMTIGAGRVIFQDLVKINNAVADGSIAENPVLKTLAANAAAGRGRCHLLGLMSPGGVHSHMDHFTGVMKALKNAGIKPIIHAFMDGRDCDPKSGAEFLEAIENEARACGASLASVIGRFYAMDRDNRWERIKTAYDLLVSGQGEKVEDAAAAVRAKYAEGTTDEFMPAMATSEFEPIENGDSVLFLNFRNDRAKELTIALTQREESGMKPLDLVYATMTRYDPTFRNVHVMFPKDDVRETIGEVVSKAGLKQLRIAETEKYAHVTFFMSGGREAQFEGEDRILIPSPKVKTYDLKPEMSAPEVAQALADAILEDKYDFICVNFANGDMVGHTGVKPAIIEAVKSVDAAVEKVVAACRKAGYAVVQIADHGNCDNCMNPDGTPNTAHSLNPVPIVVEAKGVESVSSGTLADVAPTVLDLMGIEKPAVMTGSSLIQR